MKITPKTGIWIAIVAVLGVLLSWFVIVGPKSVPREFGEARREGTRLTEEIIFAANASRQGLSEIAKYDAEANVSEALIATSRELLRNRDIRERAIKLAVELGKMAASLPNIKPYSGRAIVSEAIGYEVALVSRLITYNDDLNKLFELLRAKFTGTVFKTDGQVQSLVNSVNAGANAVNDLQKSYADAMERFDEVYE